MNTKRKLIWGMSIGIVLVAFVYIVKIDRDESAPSATGAPRAESSAGEPEMPGETRIADSAEDPGGNPDFAPAEPSGGNAVAASIEVLLRALRSEDDAEIETAMDAVSAAVRLPGGFDDLFARFSLETDPDVLTHLARVLAPHFADAGAEAQAAALKMARDDSQPAGQIAALSLLASLKEPPSGSLEAVAEVTRKAAASEVRLSAIYTLSHWADNPALWEEISDQLIETIDASVEPMVRGNAIQVIALRGGATSDRILAAMVDYLESDPTPQIRGIAALALGEAPPELRPAALGHLETAFDSESDLDIRRNIMTQIARAGESDAIPILLGLSVDDPLLEMDVIDYVELLQAGDIDPDEIYLHKYALDAERGTIVGASSHSD